MQEIYIYKKEIDWSALTDGITLPVDYINIFGSYMDRKLNRGESKEIIIMIEGVAYFAKITNVKFDPKFSRKKDTLQIRYSKEFAEVLRNCFSVSFEYIKIEREKNIKNGLRKTIKLPDEYKEFISIYATENDDIYIFEPIIADDILNMKHDLIGINERAIENSFNYYETDDSATMVELWHHSKIRKLNSKIGDSLKKMYNFRCQICNKLIGEYHGAHACESHHIDYFATSFNNNSSNQIILCPNHHSIIHEVKPAFDRKNLLFEYQNGYKEKVLLDKHLQITS